MREREMEWERHKKNKLHAFHDKTNSLHVQRETRWCFVGVLRIHLKTHVGGLCEGLCCA